MNNAYIFDNAKSISLGSMHWRAWFGKGGALSDQKKCSKAAKAYDRVVESHPGQVSAWNGKGIAMKALGRNAEADFTFAKAEVLNCTASYF